MPVSCSESFRAVVPPCPCVWYLREADAPFAQPLASMMLAELIREDAPGETAGAAIPSSWKSKGSQLFRLFQLGKSPFGKGGLEGTYE